MLAAFVLLAWSLAALIVWMSLGQSVDLAAMSFVLLLLIGGPGVLVWMRVSRSRDKAAGVDRERSRRLQLLRGFLWIVTLAACSFAIDASLHPSTERARGRLAGLENLLIDNLGAPGRALFHCAIAAVLVFVLVKKEREGWR